MLEIRVSNPERPPPCAVCDAVLDTTVAVGAVTPGVLRVGGTVHRLGCLPGPPGWGSLEVAIIIQLCHHDPSFLLQSRPHCWQGTPQAQVGGEGGLAVH